MFGTPVGLSRDLAAKHVMRAEVQGQDVAVWRDPDGDLHAWNNRCPHRGMRLSHGFVRGDKLACLYHGWHYRKDGGCSYIPAHPDLEPPATIAAQVYHVAEASGVIWVDTTAQPKMLKTEEKITPLRSLDFDCGPDPALAAFAMTPFDSVMPKTLGEHLLEVGGRNVWLLANTLGPKRSMVHVRVHSDASLAELRVISRWCDAARRRAEGHNP